jgi:hypothetical protein
LNRDACGRTKLTANGWSATIKLRYRPLRRARSVSSFFARKSLQPKIGALQYKD